MMLSCIPALDLYRYIHKERYKDDAQLYPSPRSVQKHIYKEGYKDDDQLYPSPGSVQIHIYKERYV